MDSNEARQERLSKVVRELGASIREEARGRWKGVKMANRSQRSRHVWRFRTSKDSVERFLHVPHETMVQDRDAVGVVMGQLRDARWLDRLQIGPETSFILSPSGRLQPWPKA